MLALQVLEHVTVHVAPAAHVTLVPAPAVTMQSLPESHVTLAEAPEVSAHVAWLWHSRLELSPADTVHVLCAPHCVSHDEPHAPEHVVAPSQSNTQPVVWAVHAPVPLRLHWPPSVHEHVVPVQLAGATACVPDPDDPHATASAKRSVAKAAVDFVIRNLLLHRARTDAGPGVKFVNRWTERTSIDSSGNLIRRNASTKGRHQADLPRSFLMGAHFS